MTPAARYAAAIDVLDQINAGEPAEKALTGWGRANRFAGSKDRAAVRDHVFDVLRQKRSLAALGGGTSGRTLVLGLLRRQQINPNDVFGAGGYAPTALTADEVAAGDVAHGAAALDLPDWLWPQWLADLGEDAEAVAHVLQQRGPVTLRVNLRRGTRDAAIVALAADGVTAVPMNEVKTALQVTENPRRLRNSGVFTDGLVELQDVASQAAITALEIAPDARVLDYCAGGGGKALAIADMHGARVSAHDISVARMGDIPVRAGRAGVRVEVIAPNELAPSARFGCVVCDAPCSGSGTWRRAPEAKWAISSAKMQEYKALQQKVIAKSSAFVGPSGTLFYATCSVLACENEGIVDAFLDAHTDFRLLRSNWRLPDADGDGFYFAILQRA